MTRFIASLSPTQSAIVSFVNRHGQASATQIRRAIMVGTNRGRIARASRHLKRLSERGFIKRLPYKLSGHAKGSGEFVYTTLDSKSRIPNLHTIDVTEIATRLIEHYREAGGGSFTFLPEPWGWHEAGGVQLKPDFYLKMSRRHYLGEMDLSTEYASTLSAKMRVYERAYTNMDGGSFPQVLYICHTPERKLFIEREVAKKTVKALFRVVLFEDAIGVLTE